MPAPRSTSAQARTSISAPPATLTRSSECCVTSGSSCRRQFEQTVPGWTPRSAQETPPLQEAEHDDHRDDDEEQVDQVAANGSDNRAQQPQDQQNNDDRFERVARHE